MKISKVVSNIPASPTLSITAKVKELKSQGRDIIGFGAGEPDFETPDDIKNAAIDARRNADTTMANAREEAEQLLSQARAEAESIVGSRAQQVTEIEDQIARSELVKRSYLSKLRTMIESHLEMVEALTFSEGLADRENEAEHIEVTDSAEVERNQMETVATGGSATASIETEEANAAGEIVEVDPSEQPAEASGEADVETPAEEPKPIDPELAAALESYQGKESGTEEAPNIDTDVSRDTGAIPTVPGEINETTLNAEDIPPGFIAKNEPSGGDSSATDRVETAASRPRGTAAVIEDLPRDVNTSREPVDPNALAEELDEVAAKFEEEMDKAAKG